MLYLPVSCVLSSRTPQSPGGWDVQGRAEAQGAGAERRSQHPSVPYLLLEQEWQHPQLSHLQLYLSKFENSSNTQQKTSADLCTCSIIHQVSGLGRRQEGILIY